MRKPLCIDLFAGLGGFSEGFLAEGYDCVGFDIERHQYGDQKYPAQLVLQDVLTLNGSQFKGAAIIVASPPCQEFSYMAMPWSRAKEKARLIRASQIEWARLTQLFFACFRIAREAGVPLVVENVKGAQPWVGRAQANYGSFFLWGDVASVGGAIVHPRPKFGEILRARHGGGKANPDGTEHPQGSWFKIADSKERGSKNGGGSWFAIGSLGQQNVGQNPDGRKVPMNFYEHEKTGKPGRSFQSVAVEGQKITGYSDPRRNGGKGAHLTSQAENDSRKNGGDWFGSGADYSLQRRASSGSSARKAASAQIAKIPFPLASHIARIYHP